MASSMQSERPSKMHFRFWQWNSSVLMNLFLFVLTLLRLLAIGLSLRSAAQTCCCLPILSPCKGPCSYSASRRPALCHTRILPCRVLLQQHAFVHRGTLPMGRMLACVGPRALSPVWSGCMCMCVVFPAPCSSVRSLLTAYPVTMAVYFTSVCTN